MLNNDITNKNKTITFLDVLRMSITERRDFIKNNYPDMQDWVSAPILN